jgi:crossover junction endodeoxyribonuclease RusA
VRAQQLGFFVGSCAAIEGGAVPDDGLVLSYLRAIAHGVDQPARWFVREGVPVTKGRTSWNAEQVALIEAWRAATHGQTFTGNVALVAVFFRPTRQRIDADNMMKVVMDAGTRARVWRDDSQVTAQASFVEWDPRRPRTLVAVCATMSSMDRRLAWQFVCERCNRPFTASPYGRRKVQPRFCSRTCASPRIKGSARCPKCSSVFDRAASGQKYCSRDCAGTAPGSRKPAELQRPRQRCEICGALVSRREYRRCRDCWKAKKSLAGGGARQPELGAVNTTGG